MTNVRLVLTLIAVTALVAVGRPAAASDFGTAEEARAMLERAVAALEADQAAALAAFRDGADGFKDRDLYVFCGGPDGNFTAHPRLTGRSLAGLADKTGKPLGQEIYDAAVAGDVTTVSYMWPRPGSETPVQKHSFVTKVADQVCAVGYYE